MNIVQKLVLNSGATKEEIAIHLDCSRKSVYNYLKEPKKMTAEDISKLAVLIGRSPRNLFSLIINN